MDDLWQEANIRYIGTFKNFALNAGFEWNYFGYENEIYITKFNPVQIDCKSFANYFANILFDSYNNRYFPVKGLFGHLEFKMLTSNFIQYKNQSPVGIIDANIQTALSLTDRFTIVPEISGRFIWSEETPEIYQNFVGGTLPSRYLPQQIPFPGFKSLQPISSKFILADL